LFNKDKGAGLGKLGNQGAEGGIRAQIEPMVEGLGNRIESRFLRIRTRMQTLGIGNMQSQVKEEPKREPVFYCPECNMPVEKEMLFCPSCASPLNIEAKKLKDHKEKLRISANMAVLCDS